MDLLQMEISPIKKRFLNNIGIDLSNLPEELLSKSIEYHDLTTQAERNYLWSSRLSGKELRSFSMKDVIGTRHPSYANVSWVESFIKSKRGDSVVEKYFSNPEYYEKLKEKDQKETGQDTPLELFQIDGKYVIDGGNNRLSLLKVKYLSEISKAKTQEEIKNIDDKYTFVAEVKTLPNNKKIVDIIATLENDFPLTQFKNLNYDPNSCNFEVQIKEQKYVVNSYEELKQLFKNSYSLNEMKTKEETYEEVQTFVSKYIQSNDRIKEVINEVYPNFNLFVRKFIDSRIMGLGNTILDGYDVNNINLDTIIYSLEDFSGKQK